MKIGAVVITGEGLGALQQARELATKHVPAFDFKRVDCMLARFILVIELAWDESVGPAINGGNVVVTKAEYGDMADVAYHAKLYALPSADFNFRTFIPLMNQMARAVGHGRYQIGAGY